MTLTTELLDAGPVQVQYDLTKIVACIESCFDCSRACLICADACLAEDDATDHLLACIRLNQDCADICLTTGRLLSRQYAIDPALLQAMVQTCVSVTKLCAQECESHSHHRHCELCAAACRACEDACRVLLAEVV